MKLALIACAALALSTTMVSAQQPAAGVGLGGVPAAAPGMVVGGVTLTAGVVIPTLAVLSAAVIAGDSSSTTTN